MNKDYVDKLYSYLKGQDPTFRSLEDFNSKLKDEKYVEKLHGFLQDKDPEFRSLEDFNSKIKKKSFDPKNPIAEILGGSPSEDGSSALPEALKKVLPNKEKPKSFMSIVEDKIAKDLAKDLAEEERLNNTGFRKDLKDQEAAELRGEEKALSQVYDEYDDFFKTKGFESTGVKAWVEKTDRTDVTKKRDLFGNELSFDLGLGNVSNDTRYRVKDGFWERLVQGDSKYEKVTNASSITALNNRYNKDLSTDVAPIEAKPITIDPFLSINSDFLSKTEEDAQTVLEKKFGNMGFEFKQAGTFTDYITVTPRNGADPMTFSFDEKSSDEAVRLQSFLRNNASFENENATAANRISDFVTKNRDLNKKPYSSNEYKLLFEELTYLQKKEEISRRQKEASGFAFSDYGIAGWAVGLVYDTEETREKLAENAKIMQDDLYNSEEWKLFNTEKSKFEQQVEDRYSLLLDDYEIKQRNGDYEGAREAKLAIESGFSRDVIGDNIKNLSNSQYDVMNAKNDLNAKSKKLAEQVSNGLITQEQYNIGVEALTVEQKKLAVAAESIVTNQKKMNALTGQYVLEKAKYGNFGSNFVNAFVVDAAEIIDKFNYIRRGGVDVENMTGEANIGVQSRIITPQQKEYYKNKGYNEEQIKNIRINQEDLAARKDFKKSIIQSFGSDLTTEESKAKLGFVENALVGVAASLPSMLTALIPVVGQAAAFASMANMSYNAIEEEMLSDPDFETTTKGDRAFIAVPYAAVMGALEKFGLSRMSKGKSAILGKYILGNIAKVVPKKLGKEALDNIANKEIKSLVGRGILKVVGGTLAEGETGGMQTLIADIGMKKAYNALRAAYTKEDLTELTGGEAFGTPQSFSEGALAVGEGALAEAIGGFAMSTFTVGIERLATGKISLYNKDDLKFFEDFSSDEEFKKSIVSDLKTKMLEGKMSKRQAQAALNDIDLVAGVFNSIDVNLPEDAKLEAFNLINEKRILEKEVDGKDPALSKKKNDRIAEINQELEELPSRVQEDNLTTRAAEIQDALRQRKNKSNTIRLDGKKISREDAQAELQTIITKLDENAIQKQTASEVQEELDAVNDRIVKIEAAGREGKLLEDMVPGELKKLKARKRELELTPEVKIERKRQEDLSTYNEEGLNEVYAVGSDQTVGEFINAKYDAELAALNQGLAPVTQEVVSEEVIPQAENLTIGEKLLSIEAEKAKGKKGKAPRATRTSVVTAPTLEVPVVTAPAIAVDAAPIEVQKEEAPVSQEPFEFKLNVSSTTNGFQPVITEDKSSENVKIDEQEKDKYRFKDPTTNRIDEAKNKFIIDGDVMTIYMPASDFSYRGGGHTTIKTKIPENFDKAAFEAKLKDIKHEGFATTKESVPIVINQIKAALQNSIIKPQAAPVVVAPTVAPVVTAPVVEVKAQAPVVAPAKQGTPTNFSWSKIEEYDDAVIREMMRAQNAKLENLLALKNKTTKAQKEDIRAIKAKIAAANRILDARANKEKRIEKKTEKGEVTDKSPRVSGFDQNGKPAEFVVVVDKNGQTAKVQLKKRGAQELARQKIESNLKIQTDKKGRFVETQNKSRVYIDEKVTPPKTEVKTATPKSEVAETKQTKISLRDYKTKEVRGNELKVGDIYVRDEGGQRYVYKLLETPRVDRSKRNFFIAEVELMHIGDYNNKNAKKYGTTIKNVGDKTLDIFKSNRANLRLFGNVKVIENWEEVSKEAAPVTEVKVEAPVVEESETEKISRGAEMLKNMSEDERDNFIYDWREDKIPREALPGGARAITLYEAKKLVPNPTSKPKRVTIDNAFSLSMEHSFVINIDGVIYGLNKYEDPDATSDALDKYDEPKQYVWAYTNINEGGEVIETNESNVDELINEIKSSKETKAEPVVEPKAEPVKKSTVTAEDTMGAINSIKEEIEAINNEIKREKEKARKAVNAIEAKILETKNENQKEELQFDIEEIETQLEEDLEGLKDDLDRQVGMLKEEVDKFQELDAKSPENKKTLLDYLYKAKESLRKLDRLTYAKLDLGISVKTAKIIVDGLIKLVEGGITVKAAIKQMAAKYKAEGATIENINKYLDSTYVEKQTNQESLEKERDKFVEIREAVRQARVALKSESKELRAKAAATIKTMLKGKVKSISAVQMKSIMTRLASFNVFNQNQYDNFLDYVDKVIEITNYDTKVREANVKRKNAKNNTVGNNPKLGDLSLDLLDSLSRMLNINPKLISKEVFDSYYNIVDDLSKRTTILSPGERTDLNEKVNEIVDSIEQNEEMLPDLKDAYDNYANKVVKNGVVDYAKTLTQMLEDGVINNNEFTLMKKYKSKIVDAKVKVKMTPAEEAAEKKELINEITNTPITLDAIVGDEFRLERELVKRLAKLLNKESLENLDNKQLKDLIKILDNINNGFVSKSTQQMVEILNEKKNASLLETSIPKSVKGIFKKITQPIRGVFTRDKYGVNINPLFNIDEVFGDFKTKNIFNSVLNQSAVSQQQFQSEVAEIKGKLVKAESAIASSFNRFSRNENKIVLSKFKMMVYMMQLEFESNPSSQTGDKKQVNQAMKTLDATIDFAETNTETNRYTKEDIAQMKAIKKEFGKESEEFEEDGKTKKKIIDIDKLYNSFNSAEKNALKVFDEINSLMTKKATYTATVINGNKIAPLNNYIYYNTISDSNISEAQIDNLLNNTNPNQQKGTESKNLQERTGKVSPVDLNPFAAVNSSAKSVLVNYHMTEPIRTARKTLSTVRKTLEKNKKNNENVGEQFEILSVIEKAYDTATRDLLETNFSESSNIDAAVQYLTKAGYRAMLGSATRALAELTSNAAFVTINNPRDMAAGWKYKKLANSGKGKNILTNLKSKVISRNYPEGGLSSNYVNLSAFKDRTVRNGKSRTRYVNGVKQVFDFTAGNWVNFAELIADNLISRPDQMVMKQLYFGAFSRQFKKETGIEPDFEKIEANDEEYMDKYQDALEKATIQADNQTVTAGSSMNAYMGLLQNVVRKGDGGGKAAFKTFNQFMNRFTIQEYITARKGVKALVGKGDITQAEGIQVLAAVSARMTLYLTAGKIFSEAIMYLGGLVIGYGDDDDEDEKTYLQILYQSAVSSATTLFFGRNFGNVVRSAENYFIEQANKEYGEDIGLRNKEYDSFKDALQFNQLGKVDELSDFAAIMAGPLGPVINAGTLGIKLATKEASKEDRAIETRRKEWYRFGLEAAGSFGLVPFYRDIRKVQMEWVYDELKKELKEDAAKKVIKDEKDANTLETKTNTLNTMKSIYKDERSRSIIDDELKKLSDPKFKKQENDKEEAEKKRLLDKYGYDSQEDFERNEKEKYKKVFGDDSPYRKRLAPKAKIQKELKDRMDAAEDNKTYRPKDEKEKEKEKKPIDPFESDAFKSDAFESKAFESKAFESNAFNSNAFGKKRRRN